ncbi:MAG: glycosyltransferase family 9 protein [Acidobacteriota bacterium]
MSSSGDSCLVLKNDGLGDLVSVSGLIGRLAREFDGRLDLVTCAQNREIAELIPGVRRTLYVSRDRLRFVPGLRSLGVLWPLAQGGDRAVLRELQRTEYTVAIALRRFIRQSTLVMMRRCRAEKKLCAWQFPTNLSRHEATLASRGWTHYQGPPETLSEQSYYHEFLRSELGRDVDDPPHLELPETPEVTREAKAVGLCIAGSSMSWSPEYWLALIEHLLAQGWQVHLFGGGDAAPTERLILEHHPRCVSHVGRLGFAESVPALRRLGALVGNDTGFTHFASLAVPRCLVLMGGGTFGRFFPWPGTDNQHVAYFGLDCFDCDWRCKFERRHCLDKLRPEMIIESFEQMVAGPFPRQRNFNPADEAYQLAWRSGLWPGRSRKFSQT